MRNLKFIGLIIILMNVNVHNVFGQDTILLKSRNELDRIIRYGCIESSMRANEKIRNDIDSIFETYDFNGPEYDCQIPLDFDIEIDVATLRVVKLLEIKLKWIN